MLAGFKNIEATVHLSEGGLVVTPDENNRRAKALRVGQGARQGEERHSHHAQAKYHRCAREGLVRRQGRRGIHFQAGRWRISPGRACAYGGLAQDRGGRAVDGVNSVRQIIITTKVLAVTPPDPVHRRRRVSK